MSLIYLLNSHCFKSSWGSKRVVQKPSRFLMLISIDHFVALGTRWPFAKNDAGYNTILQIQQGSWRRWGSSISRHILNMVLHPHMQVDVWPSISKPWHSIDCVDPVGVACLRWIGRSIIPRKPSQLRPRWTLPTVGSHCEPQRYILPRIGHVKWCDGVDNDNLFSTELLSQHSQRALIVK